MFWICYGIKHKDFSSSFKQQFQAKLPKSWTKLLKASDVFLYVSTRALRHYGASFEEEKIYKKKSCIRETLTLSMCENNSTLSKN